MRPLFELAQRIPRKRNATGAINAIHDCAETKNAKPAKILAKPVRLGATAALANADSYLTLVKVVAQ